MILERASFFCEGKSKLKIEVVDLSQLSGDSPLVIQIGETARPSNAFAFGPRATRSTSKYIRSTTRRGVCPFIKKKRQMVLGRGREFQGRRDAASVMDRYKLVPTGRLREVEKFDHG